MRTILFLCVAADYITFQVCTDERSLLGVSRPRVYGALLSLSYTDDADAPDNFDAVLTQGLRELKTLSASRQKWRPTLDLEVEVGARFARVGLLRMDGSVASASRDSLVAAWVAQTWNIEPSDHILRYGAVSNDVDTPHKDYLVSSIEKRIVRAIESACISERVRFTSCSPALMTHLSSWVAGTKSSDLNDLSVATQWSLVEFKEKPYEERSASTVQFVAIQAEKILLVSRQWLVAAHSDMNTSQLEQAVARLGLNPALQGVAMQPPTRISVEWPFSELPAKVANSSRVLERSNA